MTAEMSIDHRRFRIQAGHRFDSRRGPSVNPRTAAVRLDVFGAVKHAQTGPVPQTPSNRSPKNAFNSIRVPRAASHRPIVARVSSADLMQVAAKFRPHFLPSCRGSEGKFNFTALAIQTRAPGTHLGMCDILLGIA